MHCEVTKGHGRHESRTVTISDDIEWIQQDRAWPGLKAVACVQSLRKVTGSDASHFQPIKKALHLRLFLRKTVMDFRELSSGKIAISGSFSPIFAIGREAVRYGKQEAEAGIVAGDGGSGISPGG